MSDLETTQRSPWVQRLIRIAVIFAIIGLACVSFFILIGFQPLSVGLGIMLGIPLLLLALLCYCIAVVLDLRTQGEL